MPPPSIFFLGYEDIETIAAICASTGSYSNAAAKTKISDFVSRKWIEIRCLQKMCVIGLDYLVLPIFFTGMYLLQHILQYEI